jgi:hypothetical protein
MQRRNHRGIHRRHSSAAWSACGSSSGQDHSGWHHGGSEQVAFPPLRCDRYPAAGHSLRDLPAHRGLTGPAALSEVLTEHYRRAHPEQRGEALGIPSRQGRRAGAPGQWLYMEAGQRRPHQVVLPVILRQACRSRHPGEERLSRRRRRHDHQARLPPRRVASVITPAAAHSRKPQDRKERRS